MDASEIARALTEAAISKLSPDSIIGDKLSGATPKAGDAEAMGKKFGELYKGVLVTVVEATKAANKALHSSS